jgi:DNA-binding MarR family transcriptional regulator/N-acetylglutamate synthase-like GNAT family acetyltransferase
MNQINRIRAFNRFYTNRIGLLDRVNTGGLNLTSARVLYEIGAEQKATARVLANRLGLDEGYLSRVINNLAKRGLIARKPCPQDTRKFHLSLTKAGQDIQVQLINSSQRAVEEMISELPAATISQILEAMATVQGAISWPAVEEPGIRKIETGDIGWIVKRHGELYASDEGFDINMEALTAKILTGFVERNDRPAEMGWIAHSEHMRLGCVFTMADSKSTARLRLMLVEPFARGKSIGQRLLDTAVGHAKDQGFKKMVLWTQQGLGAACRLYERNGFQLVDSKPDKMFGRDVTNQTYEIEF